MSDECAWERNFFTLIVFIVIYDARKEGNSPTCSLPTRIMVSLLNARDDSFYRITDVEQKSYAAYMR